jgi:hypothetical protein
MTGRIGKITADPEVRRAKNGASNVLMLTVHFSDGGAASVQWMPGAGDDTAPQKKDIVAVERYGGVLIATASKSPGDPARNPGERDIYSRAPEGERAATLLLETDGSASLESLSPAGKQAALALNAEGALVASMAAGQNAAVHAMKPAGTHYLGNALAGQDAFTVMNTFLTGFTAYTAALITALTAATTGSPPPTLDPGALAAFTAILSAATPLQTAIAALQTQWALVFDPAPPAPPNEGGTP